MLATSALLIVIWGTTWAAVRVCLDGFPPFTGVSLRFALACVLLWMVAAWSGVSLRPENRRHVAVWVTQALFAFTVSYGTVYWAEQWVPSGLVSVLFSTMPLFVVLLAWSMLPEERLRPVGLAGVVLGFVGVAVIFSDEVTTFGGPQGWIAAVVVLFAPLSAAVVQVVVKKWGQDMNAFSLTVGPLGLASVIMAILALIFERGRSIHLDPWPVASLIYLAIFGSAVAFTLYYWLLKHISATHLSLITYCTPIVAMALGTVLLDEPLTAYILGGSALVLCGVGLVVLPRRRRKEVRKD